jgi:hypothetical protein
MAEAKISHKALVPYLDEEDFEQMRIDTRNLVVENELLRRRIVLLESELFARTRAKHIFH